MNDLIERVQKELSDMYHPDDGNLFRERCQSVIAVVLRDLLMAPGARFTSYIRNYASENGINLDE